jgi:hypothetical protein
MKKTALHKRRLVARSELEAFSAYLRRMLEERAGRAPADKFEAEMFEEERDFLERLFRVTRPQPVPRRLRRSSVWQTVLNLGGVGALAHLLNEGTPPTFLEWSAELVKSIGLSSKPFEKLRTQPISGLPEGFGKLLVYMFEDSASGWKNVEFFLIRLLPFAHGKDDALREVWREALREALIFERCGFVIAWCEHRKHYYVSDNRLRKDCEWHRKAGQQARWRERHPEWKLKRKAKRRGLRDRQRAMLRV